MHRTYRVCLILSFVGILSGVSANWVKAQAVQNSTTPYADWAVNELSRRVQNLEQQDANSRLAVLESDLTEVKYLQRSVTLAVIGQIMYMLVGMLRNKR